MNSFHERAPAHLQDEVWRRLCERQSPALASAMCREFRAGFARIAFDPTRMPTHAELSRRLFDACGWNIETVPGLIPVDDFFALLRDRRFPSPEWIRHPDDLEYTPAPDLFHDVFGHLPQLCAPAIREAIEALAERARGATQSELVDIERVYWFTIEFGLVRESGEVRALGAGLASSIAELHRALFDPQVDRLAFTFETARKTAFDPTHPQLVYLVAPSVQGLAVELGRRAQAG